MLCYLTWLGISLISTEKTHHLISTHATSSPFRETSGSVMEFVCKHSPSSPSIHPFPLTCKLNPHNRDRWLPPNRVRRIVLKYQRSAGESWVLFCLSLLKRSDLFSFHFLSLSPKLAFCAHPFSSSCLFSKLRELAQILGITYLTIFQAEIKHVKTLFPLKVRH